MSLLKTPEVETGWKAIDFNLPATDGKNYSLGDVVGKAGLVVMFISNHCPYVQSIIGKIATDMTELQKIGVGSIAIASNDITHYPEDGIENMRRIALENSFSFPYVIDETQEVAKAYGAVCTPDFYGFNADLELEYRGRLDKSGMNNISGIPRDLFNAMKLVAKTGKGPDIQYPSMGCSIKWRNLN